MVPCSFSVFFVKPKGNDFGQARLAYFLEKMNNLLSKRGRNVLPVTAHSFSGMIFSHMEQRSEAYPLLLDIEAFPMGGQFFFWFYFGIITAPG